MKEKIRNILKDIENELEDIDLLEDKGTGIAQQLSKISDDLRRSLRLDIEVTLYNGDSFDIIGIKASTWKIIGMRNYHEVWNAEYCEHGTGKPSKINFYARESNTLKFVDINSGLRCIFDAYGDAQYSCDSGYTRNHIIRDVRAAIAEHSEIIAYLEQWIRAFSGDGKERKKEEKDS